MLKFQTILDSVTDLSELQSNLGRGFERNIIDDDFKGIVAWTVERLHSLDEISRESLATLVSDEPQSVPILASCVGLTQERLKNQLKHRLGTSGWIAIARTDPRTLINTLDEAFDLVRKVEQDISKQWSLADVFLERYRWSRKTAGSAINRGRGLENEVEQVVKGLGLAYEMRTRFSGRGGVLVPCDLAIPSADDALIVGAAKGFNSTGSKLSDAVREIEEIVRHRHARQFVFAVIDGIGWKSRLKDFRRIYDYWENREIDGLYTLSSLDRFGADLVDAAIRYRLLDPT